jgi:RimJ/RimL family protein N-acetyltransferase
MAELETARLRLRPFKLDDVDAFYQAITCDPDVMRYLPGGVPRSPERTAEMIQNYMKHWQQRGFGVWAVLHKADDKLIGHCGVQTLVETNENELIYAVAKPYWGQGLISEGAHACLRCGFEEFGFDRIVAVAVAENTASRRVMVKIGMTYEKMASVYGTVLPYYAIQREQFDPGEAPYRVTLP